MADIYSQMVFSEDCELYAGHKRIWEQFLEIHAHLTSAFAAGSWETFTEEVYKEKKQIRHLYMKLQNFGHSHDKEFDDFLGTISTVIGIVDDFYLLLERGNDKAAQYLISKRLTEVSSKIEQTNQGFSKWATKIVGAE